MRNLHLDVKRQYYPYLLSLFRRYPTTVYDFACGKGTDQFIFKKLGVHIVGVDIDASAIERATSRDSDNFHKFSVLTVIDKPPMQFTLAICMFAIHYFFDTRSNLMDFWTHMKKAIHVGGRLTMCFADGDRVREICPDAFTFDPKSERGFGNEVSVFIPDTCYFEEPKKEYLVYTDILVDLARIFGFVMDEFVPFTNIVPNCSQYDISNCTAIATFRRIKT